MKTTTLEQILDWQDQALADQLAWVRAKGTSPELTDAYAAGFQQGYRKAVATLKLHNLIKD